MDTIKNIFAALAYIVGFFGSIALGLACAAYAWAFHVGILQAVPFQSDSFGIDSQSFSVATFALFAVQFAVVAAVVLRHLNRRTA